MHARLALVLVAGCATPRFVPTEPEIAPDRAAIECAAAGRAAQEALKAEVFEACERDTDCAEISPLVSGTCGRFANAASFDAHLDVFEAQTAACSQAVQVAPACPSLRAVCREGRCTGEGVAELPDECDERTRELRKAASEANACNHDAECTLLAGNIAGSVAFSQQSRDEQYELAKACGTAVRVLYGMRQPPGVEAFCFEHRCFSDRDEVGREPRQANRKSSSLEQPAFDQKCMGKAFNEAFGLYVPQGRPSLSIDVEFRVDASARLSQFQFIEPTDLSLMARAAFAARMHECPALQPARLNGKPVPVMMTYRFIYLAD